MNTNAANQQIIRILEKALDLRSFVANQYLISNLVLQEEKFFTLSFQVMEAIPEIIAMRATSEDIASSVQLLKSFYFTTDYIFIPYQIFPRLLVLKQLNKIGDRLEIISYIKSLHGSESASIYSLDNDVVVSFNSNDECMAFWRSIKYCPFKETYITAEIYSELYAHIQMLSLQEPINIPQMQNNSMNQIETDKQHHHQQQQQQQQQQKEYHDQHYQYNDTSQQPPSQSYGRKSPKSQNYGRNPSKQRPYGDGGSQKQSPNYRGNRTNHNQFFPRNQQPRQQPPMRLHNQKTQLTPQQTRHTPSVQRSRSQPLELQHSQQIQLKSQLQPPPQWTQQPQSPQAHSRAHHYLQQPSNQQQSSTQQPSSAQQILMQQPQPTAALQLQSALQPPLPPPPPQQQPQQQNQSRQQQQKQKQQPKSQQLPPSSQQQQTTTAQQQQQQQQNAQSKTSKPKKQYYQAKKPKK